MKKKLLLTAGLLISLIFTFAMTFSFATDGNVVNDVRNTVGGAENAVEGAVKDVTNTTKDATNAIENNMNSATKNNTTNLNVTGNNTQTTGYTASRTATAGTTNTGSFLGMSSTMWTWLILAVAVVAIIALVWYYSNQLTDNRRFDDNDQ